MFKRIMLSLTFLAAFGLVGVATPDTSEARRYWRGRPYYGYGFDYAPRGFYYPSYRPYSSYYYGPRYVLPRRYYYDYAYPGLYDYGYPGYYRGYYGPRSGVTFSFGW